MNLKLKYVKEFAKDGALNEKEQQEYLSYLTDKEYLIYKTNKDLYNDYYNQPNEIKAREASKYAIQKAQNFDERRMGELQASFGSFRQRTIRTAIRSSLQGFEGRSAGELAENEGSNSKRLNNILFQSVYHGAPHKFHKFSLDAIGTREGAQAHGWGLYFAEDKNISEGYRKTLTGDEFNNEKYYYDGELIEDRTQKAILSTIVENGIDKVIEVRERTLFRLLYSLDDYSKEEYKKR